MISRISSVTGGDHDFGTADELMTLQLMEAGQNSKEQTVMHCRQTGLNCATNGCTRTNVKKTDTSEHEL